MPAPLTTTSTRPERWSTVARSLQLRLTAGLGRDEPGLATDGRDTFETRLGLFLTAPHQDHLGARAGQTFSHGAAELARAADHDRNFALKREEKAER